MATPSLAMIPSGYKDGKLYSVLPNNAGGDFDVTRGSLATRVNKNGLIEPVGTLGADVVLNGDFEETGADQILNGDFSQEGVEEITNGDFATDSGWNKGTGWTISGGKATTDGTINKSLIQANVTTIGKSYKYSFTVSDSGVGVIEGRFRTNSGSIVNFSAEGTYEGYFTAVGDDPSIATLSGNTASFSIDNVSVVEVGQNWAEKSGTIVSVDSSGLVFDNSIGNGSAGVYQNIGMSDGKRYKMTATMQLLTGADNGSISLQTSTAVGTGQSLVYTGSTLIVGGAAVTETFYFTPASGDVSVQLSCDEPNATFKISNITVEEVGQEWLLSNGCSITAQGARILSDGTTQYIQQNNALVIGDTYEMEYEITESVSGVLSVTNSFGAGIKLKTTVGVHKLYAVATATLLQVKRSGGVTDITIDNIKVKRLNGDDTPRIDYTDGGCPVLLTEPQSTNLITQSNDFSNTSWLKTNLTTTSANEVNPSGDSSTYKINTNVGANVDVSFAYQVVTGLTPSVAHSYSVFAKNGGYDEVRVLFDDGTSLSNNAQATFNLNDGSITSIEANGTFSGTTAKAEDFGNGWYRCTVSSVISSTGAARGRIYNSDSTITVGDGTKGAYLYGAQFEELSYSTSLIPTYGSVRTRLRDTVTGAGTSSDFNDSEGVLFVEVGALHDGSGANRYLSINSGSTTNSLRIYFGTVGDIQAVVISANDNTSYMQYSSATISEINKIALRYSDSDFTLWVNGSQVDSDSRGTGATPIGLNRMSFNAGSSGTPFFGKTSQVQVFNTALSDFELTQLTTI